MKRPPKHRLRPRFDRLDERCLPSTLAGTWIGQDGHDLVGPSSQPNPDGVQDIRIALTGLDSNRVVTSATIQGTGGGTWRYHGSDASWAAAFDRTGASTGAISINPYQVEAGRAFQVQLTYDDNSTASCVIVGGSADPNLHLILNSLQVTWAGQDGDDLTGLGAAVGPDGIQDVHLSLANLDPNATIASVLVDGISGRSWRFGLNHEVDSNAELVRSDTDPARAELYFSPDRNLDGQALQVRVVYTSGVIVAGAITARTTSATLAAPLPPAPPIRVDGLAAQWIGQDGMDLAAPGDVHLAVSGIPSGRTVRAAVLTNPSGASWSWKSDPGVTLWTDLGTLPLGWNRHGTTADLTFPPVRDESGEALSLRLVYDDGSIALASVTGGSVDLSLRAPLPADSSVVAHPGDDLNALADQFGTIRLAAGAYQLSAPLVLNKPVTITADPGATLIFSQFASSAPWTAAIKIHAGNTTLDNFAVRFNGPIRWSWDVSYGPAVIGTTDNFDSTSGGLKENLAFTRLDLESPPAASGDWERACGLIRLASAESGRIVNCTLNGGLTEFANGPWTIIGNTYRGTPAGTFTDAVFAGHDTHDLFLADNQAEPIASSGKTWRFLVLTGSGYRDVVQANRVVGVGPMDNDTIPFANASEIILTESYRIHFEGAPSAVSADGLVIQIGQPQGTPPRSGDGVAILSGPAAGEWRRIVQVLDAGTFVLDAPLPAGTGAISIATGFVDQTFRGNLIDTRGSSTAINLDLIGNHFGLVVEDNDLRGGLTTLKLAASAAESPVFWGWTHSPAFGVVVDDNRFRDSVSPPVLIVEYSQYVKSSQGRLYMNAQVTNNALDSLTSDGVVLRVGDSKSVEPDELRLTFAGNTIPGPIGVVSIPSATINGIPYVDGTLSLAPTPLAAPGHLRLAADTGASDNDGITNDARLRFDLVSGAVAYEYQTNSGDFQAIGPSTNLLPSGLKAGANTVTVRAIAQDGSRGSASSLTFVLDTTPPAPVAGLNVSTGRIVSFQGTGPNDRYEYRVGASGPFQPLGSATSFVPEGIVTGKNPVTVRALDLAGNIGASASITLDTNATDPNGAWVGQDGHDYVGPGAGLKADGVQDIRITLGNLRVGKTIKTVVVNGYGGGRWSTAGVGTTWRAKLARSQNGTGADVYIQPYRVESGRPFFIEIEYEDGVTSTIKIAGGAANPSLRVGQMVRASIRPYRYFVWR